MKLIRQFPRLVMTPLAGAAVFFAAASSSILAGSVFAQSAAPTSRGDLAPIVQLIRDGETKDALKALKQAVKNNNADGEAWYYLGIVYLQLSDFKKASGAFREAVQIQPDLAAKAHAGLAYALVVRGRLREADNEAKTALSIDPNNVEAFYTIGIIQLRTGTKDEVLQTADTIIHLRPDFAAAYLLKSQAYLSFLGNALLRNPNESTEERESKYRMAAEALQKYLQLATDAEAQPWKEQFESLKFYTGESVDPTGKVYTGREVTTKVRLLSKPEPQYTARARNEQVVGRITIRCVFAADATIKHILIVESLPFGLTEQAVAAAKKIQFVPATLDGKPASMYMQLEYNFNLY